MRKTVGLLTLLLVCAPFIQSCQESSEAPPPGTTPIKQLIAEQRSPIEVVSFRPEANPVVRRFKLVLKNVSDKPVKMIRWTQLFFAEDGALVDSGKRDGGFAELAGIEPGETYEGVMIVAETAFKGQIVLRSVTYESLPPGAEMDPSMKIYKINYQWKNPEHDATVQALTGPGTRI